MPESPVERLNAWLKEREGDLLRDTITMLQIPSVESSPGPNAPFGPENRQALDLALRLSADAGMAVRDLEGYCGWAETGQGAPLILVLGHLDVVPVGPGWKHEPFGAAIDGGYIYARGSTDDKGPTMAAFYALRAVGECFPDLGARLRIVFGCNEESGFKCVGRYMKTEEVPTLGVAPDSGWPLYHAEKGISTLLISVPLAGKNLKLKSVKGGQRPNIVIDRCEAEVEVAPEAMEEVKAKLADAWDKNVEWTLEGQTLRIVAHGKAAHGSTPFYGDSAAVRLFRFLFEVAPFEDEGYYRELMDVGHPSGVGIGVHGRDDVSHDLTSNLGILTTEGGRVVFTVNIRYPVTWRFEELETRCKAHLAETESGLRLDSGTDSLPLYFPLDHPLVKIVCDVYLEETGEDLKPGVMGGGTYARAVPNTVSIGTGWEGDGKAHETDERLKVEHLYKMSRIYAHILYRLATHAARHA